MPDPKPRPTFPDRERGPVRLMTLLAPDLVSLSMDVEILNACLLPVVLGFLLVLERRVLPVAMRMHGARCATTYLLTGTVILFGIFTALHTLLS